MPSCQIPLQHMGLCLPHGQGAQAARWRCAQAAHWIGVRAGAHLGARGGALECA